MVRKTIQESTKGLGLAVKSLYADMIPSNRLESTIFFSTLIWFLLFSIFFSFLVDLSENQVELMGYDTFFYIGGDYPKLHLSKLLSWNLRHPCFVIFNLPSLIIDALLFYKLHVFVFSFISCIISSLSNLMIFKICREIGADKWATITAIILFPTFAHVILLSGQPETFVFTMFFMVLLILSAVLKHSNYYTDSILFLFLTGTTLTNCVKFLFVKIWEENGNIYNAIKRTTRSSWLFCIMFLLTAAGLVYRIVYKHIPLNDAIFNDTLKFVHELPNKFYLAWCHFLSEPILFHSTDLIVYTKDATVLPPYPSILMDMVIAFIYILSIYGLVRNIRSLVGKICLSCMLFDLFMHFVVGYGLNELQLFCEHWIFFVPITLSLAVSSLKNSLLRGSVIGFLLLVAVFFSLYNGYCYIHSM